MEFTKKQKTKAVKYALYCINNAIKESHNIKLSNPIRDIRDIPNKILINRHL